MVRLCWAALMTLLIFCGGQSVPSFGQSVSSAQQTTNGGLFDTMFQGVSSWLGSPDVTAPVVQSQPALTEVLDSVGRLEKRLDAIQGRVGKADRNARTAAFIGWGLLLLNGVVLLVLFRGTNRPAATPDPDRAKRLELQAIRDRQAKLASSLKKLQDYEITCTKDLHYVSSLIKSNSEEINKTEKLIAAASEQSVH